jgi:hypothetical protein
MVGTRFPSPPDRNPPTSRRRPVSGQVGEPSAFLTSGIESAMAPGARTGFAMRPGRKSGAGRPTVGRWCLLKDPVTAENVLGVGTAPPRPRPPAAPHRSCHSRATSKGQPRYRADNHGHFHPTVELVVLAGPARTHPANMPDKEEVPSPCPSVPLGQRGGVYLHSAAGETTHQSRCGRPRTG